MNPECGFHLSDKSYHLPTVVVKQVEHTYSGEIDESVFLNDKFFINQNGSFQIFGTYATFPIESLISYWEKHTLYNEMHTLFIKRLGTELRLTVSNALQRDRNPEQHPIYKLINNEALAQKLSDYFHQARLQRELLPLQELPKSLPKFL